MAGVLGRALPRAEDRDGIVGRAAHLHVARRAARIDREVGDEHDRAKRSPDCVGAGGISGLRIVDGGRVRGEWRDRIARRRAAERERVLVVVEDLDDRGRRAATHRVDADEGRALDEARGRIATVIVAAGRGRNRDARRARRGARRWRCRSLRRFRRRSCSPTRCSRGSAVARAEACTSGWARSLRSSRRGSLGFRRCMWWAHRRPAPPLARVEHGGSVTVSGSVLGATAARQQNRQRDDGASKIPRHSPSISTVPMARQTVYPTSVTNNDIVHGCAIPTRRDPRRSRAVSW